MKSLYRKFVSWLAHDIIWAAHDDGYQAGISYAMGRQQMTDGQQRALKEFKDKFHLLRAYEVDGNFFPVINLDDVRLRRYPEILQDAELQLQQAEREEWAIYLSTGTKPVEF